MKFTLTCRYEPHDGSEMTLVFRTIGDDPGIPPFAFACAEALRGGDGIVDVRIVRESTEVVYP